MSTEDEHVDVDGYSDCDESDDDEDLDGDIFGQDSEEDYDVDVENDGDDEGDQSSKENMPKKKTHHNRLEQQRRVEMAKSFKRLEGIVRSEYPTVKLVKDKTMELAADLIHKFQTEAGELQDGLVELTDLNTMLKKKLEELKKEGKPIAEPDGSSAMTNSSSSKKHKKAA